jgi:sigma-B regulation protein RsbU (phosphoserine phosphatase)
MSALPVPDRSLPGRRRTPPPPGTEMPHSTRDLLLRTWAGRLFIISTSLKLLVAVLRVWSVLPQLVTILSSAATIGLIVSVSFFVWRLFVLMKARLLWRVRRKLILSYIFIGVVPSLLIVIFFLLSGVLIFMTVSAYLFKDGYDAKVNYVKQAIDAAASEISRAPEAAAQSLGRTHRNAAKQYRGLSFVYIPVAGAPRTAYAERIPIGPWEHMPALSKVPAWVTRDGWSGTIALPLPEGPGEVEIVSRAVAPVVVDGRLTAYVVGDLPITDEMVQKLREDTGVRVGATAVVIEKRDATLPGLSRNGDVEDGRGGAWSTLFGNSVIFLDYLDWDTGATRQVSIALSYRPGELYRRLSDAQKISFKNIPLGVQAIIILLVIAGLFLIIEIVALSMGLALARSITSAIHELFMGTERVRHGDFAHRIDVESNDQLGELAGSFNQMTGSIEGLLQTAAEKKRLEEELRIARVIQMSLLPRGPLDVPGLGITALCVPAREVGGDYYDFFHLPGDRLGILIADVSGKGTSAALYMAELKGLVLALSHRYDSPRALLIEVNRIISEHLDSRSFITITYALIDLQEGVMTFCRAGHTPLIFLPGPSSTLPAAQVLTPSGMVLGLRIDGAAEKFSELLEEERVDLSPGDVIVLFTDGITEAMNPESDLFGESRLSRIVEEHGHLESGELRERIMREVEAFVGSADQHDDMTMILLKVDRAFVASSRIAV